MKLLKKFAAAAVSVVLILAALPAVPAFAETDLQIVSVNSVDFDFGRLPDNDELLAGYLQKQMYGGISLYGTTAGDRLDGIGKAIYDYLKLNIETVAAGGLDSTVFGFDLSVFSDDDINIFIQDFNTNINKILNCLLTDCPMSFTGSIKLKDTELTMKPLIHGLILSLLLPTLIRERANMPLIPLKPVR